MNLHATTLWFCRYGVCDTLVVLRGGILLLHTIQFAWEKRIWVQQHVKTPHLKLHCNIWFWWVGTYCVDCLTLKIFYSFPEADIIICSQRVNLQSWGPNLDNNVISKCFSLWKVYHPIHNKPLKWISLMWKFMYFINGTASYKVNIDHEFSSASCKAPVWEYTQLITSFFLLRYTYRSSLTRRISSQKCKFIIWSNKLCCV